MLETILPKEDFVKYIEHVKNVMAYQEGFNKLLDKHNVVGYFYYPDCATELLSLMHKIFGDADQGNCIENFCFETNFGNKDVPKLFIDQYGNSVSIRTPEELYDFLKKLYYNE